MKITAGGSPLEINRQPRILFAEDDVNIGYFVTEMLCDEGFDVTRVESGDDGAVAFDREPFNLLLTDVRMPGTRDGIDLAAYVLGKNPNMPIVVVSGFAVGLGARFATLGRKATLLRKPFLIRELISIVRDALSSHSGPVVIFAFGVADGLSPIWFPNWLECVIHQI